ncbi:5'-nucleotidase [Skermanella sp. TT6]|uniref:5'-nucleotidase n=1 Tax=Skermanella cutis TaxID=2775420 RepID=A0ABX7B6S4_9PROT|nr:5'-nucleotidase [Skermanella sp. TT6]QQP89862.1 5'-nucleotidase [Skermanella sp. TT6]
MPADLSNMLSVAVSARALFDLEEDHLFFERNGVDAYRAYQKARFDAPPGPGTAFPLIKALLGLNATIGREVVTVTLVSRNSPDLGHRLTRAAAFHGIAISRWAFTSGESVGRYLRAFQADMFLSREADAVEQALEAGIAAGVVYPAARAYEVSDAITFAFDGDAVLFDGESERIYREQGLEAFQANESLLARTPMGAGPFGRLLKTISSLQKLIPAHDPPIRVALVTARNAPAHERVLHTLDAWDVRVDQMFMLGGLEKSSFLAVLRPHIFFDDQDHHAGPAAAHVPSVRVPYRAGASAPDLAGAKILGAPAPVPLIAEAASRPAS